MEMQTIALDPIVFNNRRAEFLLPDDYYDSASMVLSNLGMFSPDVTQANDVNLFYAITCGVAGVIAKYTLLSGADEIETLEHVAQWATIKALNNQASEIEDIYHNTLHSGWNFGAIADPAFADDLLTTTPDNVDYATTFDPELDGNPPGYQSRMGHKQFPPGSSASLRVNMISGFLQATPILPMIRDLRLVIEYDTNVNHYYNIPTGEASTIPTQIFPTFPMLIVKKFVNPQTLPRVIKMPYTTVKCADGFFVPAVDIPGEGEVGLVSRNTYQSYDFMGKYLKRITVYNAPTVPDTESEYPVFMMDAFRSIGQPNEVINFVINGEKYLPDNGIDSPALKLQYLINAHGNTSIPLMCATFGLSMMARTIIGNLSLTAINVDSLISTAIQVEYTRQPVIGLDPDTAQALNILLFGEIAQVVTINTDGSITIES